MSTNAEYRVSISGWGAVSASGWGVASLVNALTSGREIETEERTREGGTTPLRVRAVPPPDRNAPQVRHPRIRRASPQVRFAAAAAHEALGEERIARVKTGELKLGIAFATMCGAVRYSNRFYGEVLRDPATASPILFPETVYNAASSHLSAIFETTCINYTLVGDSAEFVSALRLAMQWLRGGECDGCLVVGAEELDWVSGEAMLLFHQDGTATEGAGALYLELTDEIATHRPILRKAIEPITYLDYGEKNDAAAKVRRELGADIPINTLLVESTLGHAHTDRAESKAWADWAGPRIQPARTLGNAMGAGAALQAVAASELVRNGRFGHAIVSAAGHHHQCTAAWICAPALS